MKIKEMKEKGIGFVKENKAAIAVGGSVFVYGVGMYLWGRISGCKVGKNQVIRSFAKEINFGQFTRELEWKGVGQYTFDRFFNEDRFNGKINSFAKAVELLGNPENTKNITGMIICRKEND